MNSFTRVSSSSHFFACVGEIWLGVGEDGSGITVHEVFAINENWSWEDECNCELNQLELTQIEFVNNASEYILGVMSSKSFGVMRSVTDIRVGSSSDEGADWKIIGDKGQTEDMYSEVVGVITVEMECWGSFYPFLTKFEVWDNVRERLAWRLCLCKDSCLLSTCTCEICHTWAWKTPVNRVMPFVMHWPSQHASEVVITPKADLISTKSTIPFPPLLHLARDLVDIILSTLFYTMDSNFVQKKADLVL